MTVIDTARNRLENLDATTSAPSISSSSWCATATSDVHHHRSLAREKDISEGPGAEQPDGTKSWVPAC